MSCNDICIVPYDDCEVGAFWQSAVRRAAKDHRCDECGDVIHTGDRHEVVSGKWDGEFTTDRSCLTCVEIAAAFYCGPRILGQLWADIGEQVFPEWDEMIAIDCLAKLKSEPAVEKMRARYAVFQSSRKRGAA